MRYTFFLIIISFSSWATTYTVTNSNDSGTGSLRNTIGGAASGDTIIFDSSTNGNAINLQSEILIGSNKELVIIGNGKDNTIIDGSAATNFRLFRINSSCNISGITFQNGGGVPVSNAFWGGAINFEQALGALSIKNCLFENNTAYLGGAIRIQEGDLEILFSIFKGNESIKLGGAINVRSTNVATHNISNCLFYNNNTADLGGAIYQEPGSEMRIDNSTFANNFSATRGGALSRNISSNELEIYNSIFHGNEAYGAGNDIYSNTNITGEYNLLSDFEFSGMIFTPSNGNINVNPQFENASINDFRLSLNSPCINKGSNAFRYTETDLTGSVRVKSETVDMGAFESPGIIYVNSTSSGIGNDGSSWSKAFDDLQLALSRTIKMDTIWVAKGTYKPTTSADRTISFQIPDSVQVYGGFEGNESNTYDLSLRDFNANETILSGLVNSLGGSHHVIFTQNVSSKTVMDGFTITKGNANGGSYFGAGGGWLNDGSGSGNSSNPTIRNILFFNNTAVFGGGLNNEAQGGGSANPIISNCSFISNSAGTGGGAIYNYSTSNGDSNPSISNCSFFSNSGNGIGGAIRWAVGAGNTSSEIVNCVFNNNGSEHLSYSSNTNSPPKFINCTFYGASTQVINTSTTLTIDFTNCIFWNNNGDIASNNANVNITHSIVEEEIFTQGANLGKNNFFGDPKFVDLSLDIFNLRCDSPAKSLGNPSNAPSKDITGFVRSVTNPSAGAYEFGYLLVSKPFVNGKNPTLTGVPFITANSIIENTNNATYKGARYVELLPGFEVAPAMGAATVFKAEIGGGCSM